MAWVKPNNDGSAGHMAPAWEKFEDVLMASLK